MDFTLEQDPVSQLQVLRTTVARGTKHSWALTGSEHGSKQISCSLQCSYWWMRRRRKETNVWGRQRGRETLYTVMQICQPASKVNRTVILIRLTDKSHFPLPSFQLRESSVLLNLGIHLSPNPIHFDYHALTLQFFALTHMLVLWSPSKPWWVRVEPACEVGSSWS